MTGTPLTSVMYHYVRPIAHGAFPKLRGLEIEQFKGQVEHIVRHYHPISVDDLIAFLNGSKSALPDRPILLSFDDGYRDHLDHVLPILERHKIKGVFYPVGMSALGRRLIPANKVQFTLAAADDVGRLTRDMEAAVLELSGGRADLAHYRTLHFKATRIDSAEVIYVKRMLQVGLPPTLRNAVADRLFRRYVTADECGFADELYLSVDDLKILAETGHHIGCHSESHPWMSSLSVEDQRKEVVGGLRIRSAIGLPAAGFTFCYPYGDYNEDTLAELAGLGCAAAFTVEVALTSPTEATRLRLPRIDTIDLPMQADAAPNEWTLRAMAEPIRLNA